LQDLLKFRLSDNKNTDALIDVDLKRLKFAYAHSVHNNKDELYLKALKQLESKYKTKSFSAEISLVIAQYYNNLSNKYNPLEKETDKYKFYKKNAHEICNSVIEKFPKTNAAGHCKKLIVSIENHNLSFNTESIVIPGSKFSAKVTYRNTKKIFIRAAKIERANYEKLGDKYYNEDFYNKIKKNATKIYELSHNLPEDNDFNQHSVEVLLNELPVGFYVLFISDNEKFTYKKAMASYQAFTVSNLSYIKQQLYDGSYRFVVLNRTSGMPVPNVSCQAWYSKYNYAKRRYVKKFGKSYTTDKNGSFVVNSQKSKGSESLNFDFKLAGDFLTTASSSYIRYQSNERYSSVITTFFTDRAIYRPGQTIYFKGISIRSDGETNKIETKHNLTVTLKDVNNQKVSDLEVTTNEYGTFSGSFDIPMGLLNGNFHLVCSNGTKYISVEEYKRPKFEVEILPFKGNYLLNDNVEVEGKAVSYSGAALSDATVKYRVVRTPQWGGWWNWNFNSTPVEIKNGEITSNDNGHFKIKFKALPDLSFQESEYLSFSYQIITDVTDINGETQSTSKSINVGYRALRVSLPLSGLINKNDKKYDNEITKNIEIGTYNLNHEKLAAKGEIKIFKLKDVPEPIRSRYWTRPDKHLYSKEEWYKSFPGNIYDNEAESLQLEKGEQVFKTAFDTKEQKMLDFSIVKGFKPGRYVAEIYSTDAFGNKVSNKHFFNVFTDKSKKMPFNEISLFSAVKTYCEPGENAEFLIGSSEKNLSVLYEVEHKGSIVSSEYIKISKEQKLIKIPVEEKHRGNFSVHFVFVKNNRYYNHNAVVHVPFTNKNLDI
ncbi:MAG: MG2 domain-containing protein, partial [Bacteroidota bacterium]